MQCPREGVAARTSPLPQDSTLNVSTHWSERLLILLSACQARDACRFELVCSRCATACDSELQSGAIVVDAESLPTCETVPEGSRTAARGKETRDTSTAPGRRVRCSRSKNVRLLLAIDIFLRIHVDVFLWIYVTSPPP